MEIKLYKLEVIRGKEEVAKEWLNFLELHKEEAVKLLKQEQAYFEAYFEAIENQTTFVYLLFAARDIEASNNIAWKSENELNVKHFEYMKRCIDLKKGDIMDCRFYLENLEDMGN